MPDLIRVGPALPQASITYIKVGMLKQVLIFFGENTGVQDISKTDSWVI